MTSEKAAAEAPSHVLQYLAAKSALTVATASTAALPHAATMIYVNDGMKLYFCTRPGTTTARNLEQNPSVSFTIDDYSADWSKTKGVQGSGECRMILSAPEIKRVVGLFQSRYPFLSATKTAGLSFYRITPSELRFIDNEDAAGERAGEALGIEYHSSLVYSVFRGLPSREVDTLAARLDSANVAAGEVVVRQGAPADKFFIIVDGELEVVREGPQGSEVVASLKRGQFFGEVAILRDMPRTATVRAVTPAVLLTMDRDVFRSLVAQSLATTEDFDRVIRERLAAVDAGRTR